jgi:histidinol dehydrogenase
MNLVTVGNRAALAGALDIGWRAPGSIVQEVGEAIAEVRARGDAAIVEYARRFDDEGFDISKLRVPIPMLAGARSLVSREIAAALGLAKERIANFHQRQRQPDIAYVDDDGSRYELLRRPLSSVAAYVPGGGSPAPSSLLMSVVPAKIAGVSRVIVLTPPGRAGQLHPAVLFACALCGVDELYAVGGAQAIAAAAFGTESIAPVEKIVGRGGLRTTEAKRQVFGWCGIDTFGGPGEIMIVADEGANSEYVVGELLAQAERAGTTRLAVVSESRPLLEAVAQLLDTLDLRTLERSESINEAISKHCHLIAVGTRDELFEVLDRFAPAYLCLQVRDASAYLPHIHSAGAVFVGDMTPLACGEYLAGTNHVAPVSGTARFSSGLSLAEFTRSFSVVENSPERMKNDGPLLAELAELEGLPHHAQTARMRGGS